MWTSTRQLPLISVASMHLELICSHCMQLYGGPVSVRTSSSQVKHRALMNNGALHNCHVGEVLTITGQTSKSLDV